MCATRIDGSDGNLVSPPKLVFIGNPVPHRSTDWTKEDEFHISYADNIAQCDCITGMAKVDPDITVISRSMGSRRSTLLLDNGVEAKAVGNINWNKQTFYVSIIPGQIRELVSVVAKSHRRTVVIVSHGLPIYTALPILLIKLIFLRRRILWVSFLIGSVVYPAHGLMGWISNLSKYFIRYVNGIITYVPHSANDHRPDLPYAQVYFAIDDELMEAYRRPRPARDPSGRTIAYTGALTDLYGLDLIVKCIELSGDKYKWVFAGSGPHTKAIQRLAGSDRYNVEYKGILSRSDAIEVQRNADLLLCIKATGTAPDQQYQQRYAASAKVNEYLASGTPTLIADIEAIPDEMREFCERIPRWDATPEQILASIDSVLDRDRAPEVRKRAVAGQSFAFSHFTLEANNRMITEYLAALSGPGSR